MAHSPLCAYLHSAAITRLPVRARALCNRACASLQSAALETLDERLPQRARGDCGARSYAFLYRNAHSQQFRLAFSFRLTHGTLPDFASARLSSALLCSAQFSPRLTCSALLVSSLLGSRLVSSLLVSLFSFASLSALLCCSATHSSRPTPTDALYVLYVRSKTTRSCAFYGRRLRPLPGRPSLSHSASSKRTCRASCGPARQ